MKEPRIVLLERDDQARELYTEYLVGEGFRVRAEPLFDDAMAAVSKGGVPLVVAGIAPGGATVGQIATAIRRASPHTALLALLGRDASEGTLRAVRDGALEALAKPVAAEVLAASVRRCLETVALLEQNPEMRRAMLTYQAARRLQRALDPATLAEQLLDVCLYATGGEGGVVLRPGADGAMEVWGARQLDEAGARELAAGLDWAVLTAQPGLVVPVPGAPGGDGAGGGAARGRGKAVAQLTLVRVGTPGEERLWVGVLHSPKSAAAWAGLGEPERTAREQDLALFASQAMLAMDLADRFPAGGEPQIDPLTDLVDARALERAVAHDLQLAQKSERQVAVLALEVGRLDEVKQAHGDLVAGQALVEAARLVTRSVRDVDLVARTGPQSFGVLLAATDGTGATRAADRLRSVFQAHRFLAREGLDVQLAVGVGTAIYPEGGDGARGLLDAAHQAARARGGGGGRGRRRSPRVTGGGGGAGGAGGAG